MRKIYRKFFECLRIEFLTGYIDRKLNILKVNTKKTVTLHRKKMIEKSSYLVKNTLLYFYVI